MTDIFQEVEEDLRRERLKKVWDKYGIVLIAVAVLIVAVTAGWRGYDAWQTNQQRATGDRLIEIATEAGAAQTADAAERLAAFAEEAPSGYAMLADFRAATAFHQAGQSDRAVSLFESLTTDGSVPDLYQDLARLRLAQVLIDTGANDEAQQAVAALAEDTANPYNRSAQELMGLAAYAGGNVDGARRWFGALVEGAGVPQGAQARARFMLALLDQTTATGPARPDNAEAETVNGTAEAASSDEPAAVSPAASSQTADSAEETN